LHGYVIHTWLNFAKWLTLAKSLMYNVNNGGPKMYTAIKEKSDKDIQRAVNAD